MYRGINARLRKRKLGALPSGVINPVVVLAQQGGEMLLGSPTQRALREPEFAKSRDSRKLRRPMNPVRQSKMPNLHRPIYPMQVR